MGRLIREMDWARTPLGPIDSWPQSLRTTVSLCLASNFPISIAWGPQRTQIYNDGYWPICGQKHPHSMGQDFKECWFSAWPAIGEAFEKASGGETAFLVNQRMFLDRDGYLEETFFTFSFSPIRDESGGVAGLFHPVTELTQQSLAERRLQVLRDLADRASESTTIDAACVLIARTLAAHEFDLPVAILYRLDAEGRRAALACSAGLPTGTPLSPEAIDLDSPPQPGWPLAEAAREGVPLVVEELPARFGAFACGPYPEPPHTAFVLPIPASGLGHPFGVLVAGVSARRALDERHRTFFLMLREAVTNVITNARAHEEERRRAEALAELDRAKTVFFSNVSHEFRTPLTLMLGPLEELLLRADPGRPAAEREQIEIAHRNALRLLKLVNTLLDFSRIEAGRIQAAYEPTDLAAFTAELASVFRSAIERAGLRLVVDCPPSAGPVHVDREMWEKIVLNLLSNAFKFTFEGEIEVAVRQARDAVELTVRDSGTGVPAHELPHLFERFHRVEGARGRTAEGSGIGLALVHELVKLHGGTVRVESEVGRGSRFVIAVPAGTAHLPPDRIGAARTLASTALRGAAYIEEALRWLPDAAGPAPAVPAATADPLGAVEPALPAGPRPRVLLAEDNADMREYARRLLSTQFEVEPVGDGLAALRAAQARRPDLVLTDVMMPGLDGFGLLGALRGDPALKNVPVIMLSARAGEEARIEGMQAGADDYLVKPFSAKELLARVDAQVRLHRQRLETQAALRASEDKFATAFARSPLALTITSLDDGRLVEVNEGFVRLSGYARDEAVGRTPDELGLWIEPQRRADRFARLSAGEPVPEIEARFRRKNGEEGVGVIGSALVEIGGRRCVLSSVLDITARQRAEETSRRYAHIFNQAGFAIAAADPVTNRLELVNPAFAAMHGRTVDEMLGMPLADTFAPEERARLPEHVARAHELGDYVYESLHVRKDGSTFPVLTHVSALKDAAGNVLYRAATFQDITERKQTERLLLEQKRLLELVASGGSLQDCLTAVCSSVPHLSPGVRACVLLADQTGTAFDVAVSTDLPQTFADGCRGAPADEHSIGTCGTAVHERRPTTCADVARDRRWAPEWRELCLAHGVLACHSTPVLGAEGRVFGTFTLCFAEAREPDAFERRLGEFGAHLSSIAIERHRSEEALHESEARIRTFADAAPAMLWVTEPDGSCSFLSRGWYEFTGQTEADGLGYGWLNAVHPDDRAASGDRFRAANERQESFALEYRIRHADGTYRWAIDAGRPRFAADGAFLGFVGSVIEITDRKRAEEDAQFLGRLGEALRHAEDEDALLQALCELTAHHFDASHCAFGRIGHDGTAAVVAHEHRTGDVPSMLGRYPLAAYPEAWNAALRAGQPVAVTDVAAHAAADGQPADRPGHLRSLLVQPVLRDNVWVGSLVLNRVEPRAWTESAVRLVGIAAERGWLALERLRAERAVRESQLHLKLTTEAARVGTWQWNVQTGELAWSALHKALWGYDPARQLGYTEWARLIHPDDLHRAEAAIQACLERRTSAYDVEYRITPVGESQTRWIRSTGQAVFDEAGRALLMQGVSLDITARKLAEEALRESEQRFRLLADAAPVLIWISDTTRARTWFNRRWLEFVGCTLPEGVGDGWVQGIHPDDLDRCLRTYVTAFDARQDFTTEYRLRRHDGEYRWMLDNGIPTFGPGGEFTGYLGSCLDITERKQTEATLLNANRVKDEFLATLSHELRTPLNAVLGWAQMLRTGALRAEMAERAFDSLERNARAQTQLVDDLLDVSRIVSGKLQIRDEIVDLPAVTRDAVDTVRATASARQVALRLDVDVPAPCAVRGDPDRLRQIVWNLLSNAIKFTPAGGRVDVVLRPTGAEVEIVVRDSGVGIDAEFLPYVFDRFRQADSTTTRRYGGLGLGLAIVRHLTEAHGGVVSAESDGPDRGATFTIRLPLVAPERAAVSPSLPAPLVAALDGTSVLIVDDEADARDLLSVVLEAHGADVTVVGSAGEALYALQTESFDVLVADIGMPIQDGFWLIRVVRDLPGPQCAIPAIAVTAYASLRDRELALQAGYDWHLSKPVEADQLIATVASASPAARREPS